MSDYLKNYKIKLKTCGPVYIGNGKNISKKEYLFTNGGKKIAVIDPVKLYEFLKSKGKNVEFEKYLLENNKDKLGTWLENYNIKHSDIVDCLRYEILCGDLTFEKGKRPELKECIKDSYNLPYVPGSSLKGAFRTILLSSDILNNHKKYELVSNDIYKKLKSERKANLNRDLSQIEEIAFRTINRPETKQSDAVNDVMQGMIFSDSEPIKLDDIILCQRKDLRIDGKTNNLPIFLECIKPDTEIVFTLTIDTKICSFDVNYIKKSIELFANNYNQSFAEKFGKKYAIDTDELFLGGASGFASKTVDYSLFGENEGVDVVSEILSQNFRKVNRNQDKRFNVSPRTIKIASYNGKEYSNGLCKLIDVG